MHPRPPTNAGILTAVAAFLIAVVLVPVATAGPALASPASPASLVEPSPGVSGTLPSGVARSGRSGTVVGGQRLGSSRLQLALTPGVPVPPAPLAKAWLVADLNTRQVLAARNAHLALAPASTLKIFTALALVPTLDLHAVYTARFADAAVDGTKVGVVPGSRYTVDDLVHGMLMGSGNDCAHALGNLAGGQATAIGRMKAEADELGAFDTVPKTTSGLDAPGQVTSAYDLALAGAAALAEPRLEKIMTTTAYRFPSAGKSFGPKRKRFATQNHNHLLGNVVGATGVKNGYTVAARGSFVGSATRGGHSYLVVVLRTEGNTWLQSAALLEWAFHNGAKAAPVGELVRPGTAGVLAASTGVAPVEPGTSHLPGATLTTTGGHDLIGRPGRALTALRDRLDRAGLDGGMILLTTAAALVAVILAGVARLLLSRRGRARRRPVPQGRARHNH